MRFAGQPATLFLSLVLTFSSASAQQPAPSQTELQKEDATAESLYQQQNFIGALPLYEDLHKQVPQSNLYRERLAMALIGSAGGKSAAEQQAITDRARKLLLEAQAAGDNNNLLQVLLEKLGPGGATAPKGPPSPGAEAFGKAEKAFSSGDLAGAVKLYEEAFAADPKLYEAPLYAGDSEFKLGHYAEANAWYAKAVAVDPDRETAYRYWGDSLMKMGSAGLARDKFIESILAQPYQRAPRIGLKQWADANHMRLVPPPVTLPGRPTTNANGGATISVDASTLGSPMVSANLAYQMGATVWRNGMFQKTYPNEKQYRHSLAEEVQSIHVALSSLNKVPEDKWDASWKLLSQLDKDGLLECWILLDHPDQGIAQDYIAFRTAHRDLLRTYIAKYDLHPA
jgi:tetratricopeptide (TPR) repeat protein